MKSSRIQNKEKLEFAVFCIENLASHFKVDGEHIYSVLAEKNSLLYDYIIPAYNILHTQDKEYIINDIIEVITSKGIEI